MHKLKSEIAKLKKKIKDSEWASKKTNESIKILYKELEEKNKKLKEIDRIKSQFVSNVAHEFKTPLAIVRECIDLVLGGHAGDVNPKQKEMLERGAKTLNRLIRLVMDLLDLARIESGKTTLKREAIDPAALAEEIFTSYEGEIAKKEITFERKISPDTGIIQADKDKISEVIINLLSNAIKYTPKGGHVTAGLGGDEKKIRFEISDNGPGIPRNYLKTIFDKFERITAEKEEGTGLGLPIARDIIALHKGRLWVESEPGKGSTFIFTLPRSMRKAK